MAYKTIKESFWTDPKVKKLSPYDKLLFIYLITNPHAHYSGIYYMPLILIEDETGLKMDAIKKGLTTLQDGGFVKFDKELNIIWIVKMAKHQIAHGNQKNITNGISKHLTTLHNSLLIKDYLKFYGDLDIDFTIPSGWDGYVMVMSSVTDSDSDSDSEKKRIIKETKVFRIPQLSEVESYCIERNNYVNAEKFHDFYTANGWRVGKNSMKDWKAAVRTWEKSDFTTKEDLTVNKIGRW